MISKDYFSSTVDIGLERYSLLRVLSTQVMDRVSACFSTNSAVQENSGETGALRMSWEQYEMTHKEIAHQSLHLKDELSVQAMRGQMS